MSETLLNPYFGEFGGMYVPEILVPVLQQLEKAFVEAKDDPEFQREFQDLLKNYAGRPTALTLCRNLTKGTKAKIYLKREDLLHGGAHKTNQVLGQILLAKRMGKTRIIAPTWCCDSPCLCNVRYALPCLYGGKRRRTSITKRIPYAFNGCGSDSCTKRFLLIKRCML